MANPFVKFWKYLMASFSSKIDEHADPKVQIQQAIEEAQRNHQALSQQAAAVIGNQRQLEMKLNRQLGEVEKLQASTRQALVLADEARAKRNATMLQQKLAERTKLLSQLEQAKMQERVSASLNQMSELAAPGNTPSLEEVREKIEKRYTTALGSAELAQNSVQGRMLEVQASTTQMAGHTRLEQIRASMKGDSVAQVTGGNAATTASKSNSADIQREVQARVQAEQQKNQA
jgi:phage shock protein A